MKIKVFSIVAAITVLIMLTSCGIMSASTNHKATDDVFTGVSVESLMKFLSSEESFKYKDNLQELTAIDITKKYDSKNAPVFLAKISVQFMWESELFILSTENGEISAVVDTGLSGNKELFSYDVVNISQGTFIAAYCASHMGNGNLEFVSPAQPGTIKYTIPFAVDCHFEQMEQTAKELGLSNDDSNVTVSAVYLDGKIHANYIDVNEDGHTDIVLSGVQQIYISDENAEQAFCEEYFVKNIYLFDENKDDFILNEELSEKILLTSLHIDYANILHKGRPVEGFRI